MTVNGVLEWIAGGPDTSSRGRTGLSTALLRSQNRYVAIGILGILLVCGGACQSGGEEHASEGGAGWGSTDADEGGESNYDWTIENDTGGATATGGRSSGARSSAAGQGGETDRVSSTSDESTKNAVGAGGVQASGGSIAIAGTDLAGSANAQAGAESGTGSSARHTGGSGTGGLDIGASGTGGSNGGGFTNGDGSNGGESTTSGGSNSDESSNNGEGGFSDTDQESSTDAGPVSCEDRVASDEEGIFVDKNAANDANSCGSRQYPCSSIQTGIQRASGLKSVVYVAPGQYTETITLLPHVRVEGGWQVAGTTWTPDCRPGASSNVAVQAPANAKSTVVADNLGGAATLASLTVLSKPAALAGESLYGVVVRGATTDLTLEDVQVAVAGGGNGVEGARGTNGGDGGKAGCSSGSGVRAGSGADGADASSAGTFGADGYHPTSGAPGGDGSTAGSDGTAPSSSATCVDGCTQGCPYASASSCGKSTSTPSCGTNGLAGCAGQPGKGGGAGGGGGSSIGVFVWDAIVNITRGSIESGPGGRGGAGGYGGSGGRGQPGVAGQRAPNACVKCSINYTYPSAYTCTNSSSWGQAGAAGGTGADGSPGGAGGGGSGGFSYAIFRTAASTVNRSETTLLYGAAGQGYDFAAPGSSGEIRVQ